MKHYAKKRESVRAVQWTGEMVPKVRALLGERPISIDGDRQLVFSNAKGPGRFARMGDWIVSFSGEDFSLVGADEFRNAYDEVDETGRVLPSDAEHEAAAREFVRELDMLLIAGLKLSREESPDIFRARDRLVHRVRHLLDDERYTSANRERQRIKEKIVKDLIP